MPSQSRRLYLRSVALAATGVLAGCPGDGSTETGAPDTAPPTDATGTASTPVTTGGGPSRAATPTEDPTATPSATEAQTATPDPTDTPEPRVGGGPGPQPDAAWPLPERSAANGAYNPTGAAFEESPSVDGRVTATRPRGTEEYDPAFLHPVVADGRVYAVNALRYGPEQPAPERQRLRAFDAASGEQLWAHDIVDETERVTVPTTPAVADGVVSVAAGETLRAVDAADGSTVWTRSQSEIDAELMVPASDRTYVTGYETVAALDDAGEVTWTVSVDVDASAPPARGRDALYVGTHDGRLVALDPATGDRRWTERVTRVSTEDWSVESVVTADRGAFVRLDSGDVCAVDGNGSLVWRAGGEYTSLAGDGTRLYCGTHTGWLRALDAATGDVDWEVELGNVVDSLTESPVVTGDLLYATVDDDRLAAVRTDDGTELWRLQVRFSNLALGGDALFGTRRADAYDTPGELLALR